MIRNNRYNNPETFTINKVLANILYKIVSKF